MVAQLGEDPRIELVHRLGQTAKIGGRFGLVNGNHGFVGHIVGADAQLTDGDQAAPAPGAPLIVVDVAVVEPALPAEIGSVGYKTDSVGQFDTSD